MYVRDCVKSMSTFAVQGSNHPCVYGALYRALDFSLEFGFGFGSVSPSSAGMTIAWLTLFFGFGRAAPTFLYIRDGITGKLDSLHKSYVHALIDKERRLI